MSARVFEARSHRSICELTLLQVMAERRMWFCERSCFETVNKECEGILAWNALNGQSAGLDSFTQQYNK